MATNSAAISSTTQVKTVPKGAVVLLGRVLYASVFLVAGLGHFSKPTIAFAAFQGVPLASIAVMLLGTTDWLQLA